MRALPLVAAALLLAGCITAPGTTTTTTGAPAPVVTALPAPVHASVAVTGSFAGANFVPVATPATTGLCAPAQTAKCYRYPFEVNATHGANTTAVLSWTVQGSDFDLYVMQGDTLVSNDGINSVGGTNPSGYVPVTSQTLHAALGPGKYEFLVVAWSVAQDTFTLDATFAA